MNDPVNDWQLVRALFEETASLEPSERRRVLRERSRGRADIERRVEALFEADSDSDPRLEGSALELLEELRDEPSPEELCGATFGPYRVDAYVASGGMAHVYRATRTQAGTERRVALKVLRPGLDTRSFLERFRRERATLASLEHENVVGFLDAGELPDARPYLVMEFVDGVPLADWARGVPLRARLTLFTKVLDAVGHAHGKLVLHRDVKPSNVLVTPQGVPKLLDFGVASVLEGGGAEAPERSPLTPAYASPELLRGEPATTASDVWSLGVLLREIVGADGGADLDAIVARATAPVPGERYASTGALALDLRRHLAAEPVSARPATWRYRTGLLLRRNRWPAALAAAVLAALVAGWVGSDLRRRAAEREAGLGWRAHAQARLAAHVFEGWIAQAAATDPDLAESAAAHLERTLDEELGDWPEAEVLVRLTLAELDLERGEPERAARNAQRALELARTTRGLGADVARRAEELVARAGAGESGGAD